MDIKYEPADFGEIDIDYDCIKSEPVSPEKKSTSEAAVIVNEQNDHSEAIYLNHEDAQIKVEPDDDDDEFLCDEGDTKEECSKCGLKYALVKVHLELAHSKTEEHRCMICGLPFHDEDYFFKHLFTHTDTSIQCYWCSKRFDCCEKLLVHIEKHPSAHVYFCKHCKVTFATVNKMLAHFEICLPELKCPVCKELFSSPVYLAYHYRSEHVKSTGKTKAACQYCGKVLAEIKNYRAHIRRHLNIRPFKCAVCNDKFVTKKAVKQHIHETHMPKKKFECNECGLFFLSKSVLDAHTLKLHLTDISLECEHCKKRFNYKHVLKEHKKEVLCEVCGQSSPCHDFYQLHLETHLPICNICSKTFSSFPVLRRHRSIEHKDLDKVEERLKCEVCSFITSTSRNLMKHKRRRHSLYTMKKESLEKKRNTMKQQLLMFRPETNQT